MMLLQQIKDENDLKDDRTYLCCRASRHGNAIWETCEARKHRLFYANMWVPLKTFDKVFDLPKTMAETA